MARLSSGMYLLVLIAVILAGGLTLLNNPYKSHYQREKTVSYEEVASTYPNKVGYPAGKDIPVAKSIEDIMNNKYCTIEVSKENIESLRYFKIKDRSEAGHKSSKVGRNYSSTDVYESYATPFSFLGNIKYSLRQLFWNLDNTSYGEWCIVTLPSCERVLVFVDLKLIDISDNKMIKLPIGEIIDNYYIEDITDGYEVYGLEEENATWYVDMVGDWEETEVGDINVMWRFTLALIIIIPVLIFICYKYALKKGFIIIEQK